MRGAAARVAVPYDDPKAFDGTSEETDVVPFWFTLLRVSKYLKSQFSSSLPIVFSLEGSRIQVV